jgi:energy-coupling factor transport system permease protein
MWKSYVKIICSVPLIVLAFILQNFVFLALISLISLVLVRLFDKELKRVVKSLIKFLIPTIPLLLIMWSIFSGFETAITATFKFSVLSIVLFASFSCFEVQETFELLSKIFPYKFSYIIVLCVRYLDIIKEDISRINLIRKARGFENRGNIIKKIKSKMELIVPVFVDSLLKAEDITCALESRCFGVYKKRTFWKPDFEVMR